MSSSIQVDIDELESISRLFLDGRDRCKLQGEKIRQATEELLDSWIGESKKAFEGKYNEIKNQMSSYEDLLEEISKEIQYVELDFEKADKDIERRIKAQ